MTQHFQSFTPAAMRNLAGELGDCVHKLRNEVPAMLASFRQQHRGMAADLRRDLQEQEAERQQQAEQDTEASQVFFSELKLGARAFLERFKIKHREMAAELRLAQDAWKAARANPGTGTEEQGSGRGSETPKTASSSHRSKTGRRGA